MLEDQLYATVRKGNDKAVHEVQSLQSGALRIQGRLHRGRCLSVSRKQLELELPVEARACAKVRRYGTVQRLVVLAGRFEVGLGDSGDRANGLRSQRVSFARLGNLAHYL